MTKKTNTPTENLQTIEAALEGQHAAIAAEALADAARARSVVKPTYKLAYAAKAIDARLPKGVSRKAAARSCGDWLALTIAKLCIVGKNTLDVEKFEALLDANGVAHAHWNRATKGWQGRLRMTGRLALQRVVAEADGELELANGERLVAPRNWVAKYAH